MLDTPRFRSERPNQKGRDVVTVRMVRMMKAMRADGMSYQEIGREFGVSGPTVWFHLADPERREKKRAQQKLRYTEIRLGRSAGWSAGLVM